MADIKAMIHDVDTMFVQIQWLKSYEKMKPFMDDYLPKTEEKDWDRELILRWARALYYYGKFYAPKEEKEALLKKGLSFTEKLLSKDSTYGQGHLWYAVLLDGISELIGVRARINTLVPVEEHLRKATDLLPDDPIAQHGLGKFYYELADLPWLLKGAVKLVYGGKAIPVSTFELALERFLKADQVVPDFYSMNTAYIGRCYVRLKQNEKAIPYLRKAAKWEVKFPDDEDAKKHGADFLKQIGAQI